MPGQPLAARINEALSHVTIMIRTVGEYSWDQERALSPNDRRTAGEAAVKVRAILSGIADDLETDTLVDPITTAIRTAIVEMIRQGINGHVEDQHPYRES